jgi:phosphoglycerol transferase MdoB-like AlkP superfamily enzyme
MLEEIMPRSSMPAKRKAALETISHILVGFALVVKGIDKAEHFSRHPLTVVCLFAAGAFIVLGALFHHRFEKKIPNFTALFHVAEGISLILVGFVLLEKSSRMPYFMFFIGACYLGIGGFEFFTAAEAKKRLRPVLMAILSGAFLAAAAVALVLNTLGSRNTWVYIMSGLLVVMAAVIPLVGRKSTGE